MAQFDRRQVIVDHGLGLAQRRARERIAVELAGQGLDGWQARVL